MKITWGMLHRIVGAARRAIRHEGVLRVIYIDIRSIVVGPVVTAPATIDVKFSTERQRHVIDCHQSRIYVRLIVERRRPRW